MPAPEIIQQLLQQFSDHIRITVGRPEQVERVIEALQRI